MSERPLEEAPIPAASTVSGDVPLLRAVTDADAGPEDLKGPSLTDSMRRLRLVSADHGDVVSDLREAERARLEMLNEALEEMKAEIPEDVDLFTFDLAGGETPRLWIDATTHVHMARDRRTYRVVKDTRVGRMLMTETRDILTAAKSITDYVAARIVEREQALEVDWMVARSRLTRAQGADPAPPAAFTAPAPDKTDALLQQVASLADEFKPADLVVEGRVGPADDRVGVAVDEPPRVPQAGLDVKELARGDLDDVLRA